MFQRYIIIGCSILLCFMGGFTFAQTTDQLQGTIDQKQAEISNLEAEIAKYQAQASKLSDTANDLSTVLQRLQISERKLEAQINLTKKQIDQTMAKLVTNQQTINNLGRGINKNTGAIEYFIRRINENESSSIVEVLGSGKTLSEFFESGIIMQKLNTQLGGVVLTMKDQKTSTESAQLELKKNQEKLIKLQNELADQEKIVAGQRAEHTKNVVMPWMQKSVNMSPS